MGIADTTWALVRWALRMPKPKPQPKPQPQPYDNTTAAARRFAPWIRGVDLSLAKKRPY